MSKIRLAEYHYRKALEIHPRNAVLLGCVGMVRVQILPFVEVEVTVTPTVDRLSNVVEIRLRHILYSTRRFVWPRIMHLFVIEGQKCLSQ